MLEAIFSSGLLLPWRQPGPVAGEVEIFTEKAALTPAQGEELRVDTLVSEDEAVAQGQPLLRLRAAPQIALVAPMAGRVARIELAPGRRLAQLVIAREGAARHEYRVADGGRDALRGLMQGTGLWRMLRSRPFGRMPRVDERPAAIFIMAADTRPGAPAPSRALLGREEDFARGLSALADLAAVLCLCGGTALPVPAPVRHIRCGRLHPQGLAGIQIHRHHPARIEAPVWDIHAEDVADLGVLLASGLLPQTRLVSVTGAALRDTRLVRCQPGADLRGLCQDLVKPGPHEVLSGPLLAGRVARWLGPRDRQVIVQPRGDGLACRHWFGALPDGAALPVIPTAALDQALGGALPAAALVRALASGDQEGAVRLGLLSLLEEDLALADYVTAARPRLAAQLRILLDRIEAEEAPA